MPVRAATTEFEMSDGTTKCLNALLAGHASAGPHSRFLCRLRATRSQCPLSGPCQFGFKGHPRAGMGESCLNALLAGHASSGFLAETFVVPAWKKSQCPLSGPCQFGSGFSYVERIFGFVSQCPLSGPCQFGTAQEGFNLSASKVSQCPLSGPCQFGIKLSDHRVRGGMSQCPLSGPCQFGGMGYVVGANDAQDMSQCPLSGPCQFGAPFHHLHRRRTRCLNALLAGHASSGETVSSRC